LEHVIQITGISGCCLGILYFLIRFFFFGFTKSFESELEKVTKLKYLLLISKGEKENDIEKFIRVLSNLLLRGVYLSMILAIILMFIFTLKKTLI